jgi:hypothetical protein
MRSSEQKGKELTGFPGSVNHLKVFFVVKDLPEMHAEGLRR